MPLTNITSLSVLLAINGSDTATAALDPWVLTLNFALAVFASIIAGIVLLVLANFLSANFRWILITILNALIHGDIETIFRDAQHAQHALMTDLAKSQRVWIFAGRGSEFSRHTFDPLFTRPASRPVELRVLLPLTDIPAGQFDWTSQRATELNDFDPGSGDALVRQIDANVSTIASRRPHGNIAIRRYNVPHTARIILTDRYVYFTPYQADSHGKNSPVYQFRRGGSFYGNLSRFIIQVWNASVRVPQPGRGIP